MIIFDKNICSIEVLLKSSDGYITYDGVEEFSVDDFLSIAFIDDDGNVRCDYFAIDTVERFNVWYSKAVGVIGEKPRG